MQRKHILQDGIVYHVYNRGVDKRILFIDDYDSQRFLNLLYYCNDTEPLLHGIASDSDYAMSSRSNRLVDLYAYCLMPNHFHLLVRQRGDEGLRRFMQKLLTAYSMYFNEKYGRSGTLFEGPYKTALVDTDRYFKYVMTYIHLNPANLFSSLHNAGKIENIEKYPYSSYGSYVSGARNLLLTKHELPIEYRDIVVTGDVLNIWAEAKVARKELES